MRTRISFLLVGVALLFPLATVAGESDDWIGKYIITKTTETVDRNSEGNTTAITVVRESSIAVTRRVIEVRRPDENGDETIVSRRTETYDRYGCCTEVVEESLVGSPGLLTVVSITSMENSPTHRVTTCRTRDSRGNMQISRRTTVDTQPNGAVVTTVETPDGSGDLVVTQTTKTYVGTAKPKDK